MPRVLLVGWDGADWRILDPLLERGDLPNLQALISRGQRAVLRSTVPTHSWAACPSFLTGVDPADHGVYDILETVPGTHKQYPVTYRSITEGTFVEDVAAAGKVGVYADVPLMFPAPDVGAGKILAGGVLPKGRVYSHPADLPDTLEKAGKPWVINGMSWTTYRHRPEPYLDDALGSFVSRTDKDDLVIFMSDHGFQSCDRTIHMDHLLKRFGYLEFSASNVVFGPMQWGWVRNVARKVYDTLGLHGKVSLPQSVNWSKTKAYTSIRSTGEG